MHRNVTEYFVYGVNRNLPYLLASFSVQLATVYEMSENTCNKRIKRLKITVAFFYLNCQPFANTTVLIA